MKAPVETMSRLKTKALVVTRVMELPRAPKTRTRLRPAGDEGEGKATRVRAEDEGDASRQRRGRGRRARRGERTRLAGSR
jgi:hypothetical protein